MEFTPYAKIIVVCINTDALAKQYQQRIRTDDGR